MIRLMMIAACLFFSLNMMAATIVVKNIEELNVANKQAKPGDTIILKNGEWKNVTIALTCTGTKEQRITFKAETPGKVLITGLSQLRLGGSFITVDGLNFTNGYAGNNAVFSFRTTKDQLANDCRITNCVINDFNNPKRMDENNWVLFYGKRNRLDNCSFVDKKNMGVLLAVILDDDRSRENFHSIDHNYFGRRIPLASNGGEIIRVGVSQHCQFNSNTQILDNFFEHCDGETEIISIKSGSNVVKGNLFKESQGSVVLRHGDNNTVENNIFLGNDKEGTGGVRVINKGQWVVNNIFYKCRGTGFRSPLAVMNGIPNSPAHRYVQVTDAVIMNNTFYNCSPLSLCEGSDTERVLPPANVIFVQNLFYNTRDKSLYNAFDKIDGFSFANNKISESISQDVPAGFIRTSIRTQPSGPKDPLTIPYGGAVHDKRLIDSLHKIRDRRYTTIWEYVGYVDAKFAYHIQLNAAYCGADWFKKSNAAKPPTVLAKVSCKNAEEVYKQLERKEQVSISLTGKKYEFNRPLNISKNVVIASISKTPIEFIATGMLSVFNIQGNGNLSLRNLTINGAGVKTTHFISSDSTGSSEHYNLSIKNCTIQNFDRNNGCQNLFYAYKSIISDSIIIRDNSLLNNNCNFFMMVDEKDNRGYYNAEKIDISRNTIKQQNGVLVDVYRGGNDESTLGPLLLFTNNTIAHCNTANTALLNLYGVQKSLIEKNNFAESNNNSTLIKYEDLVRAVHLLRGNSMKASGNIITNKFVQAEKNTSL